MKTRNIKINGKIIPTVTIGELAKLCNKSTSMMRKWEERNILLYPNIRGKSGLKANGDKITGSRRYSVKLALRIAEILKDVKQGVKLPNESRREIAIAFQNEKHFIYGEK